MRFSSVYADTVLAVNFRDARRLFLRFLLDLHRAHLIMLVESRILPPDVARLLAEGLCKVEAFDFEAVVFDGSFEDLFCCVERLLEEACGSDAAGRLHTARSRNDIDVTLYRMRWREETVGAALACCQLRKTLLRIAAREAATIMPAYTHTQPAQPITLGHFLQGAVERLERDHERLLQAIRRMNRCPLGACAIAGTGFPIDRFRTSELLAFDGPTENTYASIADVDYLLEAMGALMTLMTETGRLIQNLLLWSTQEFGFLLLDEAFVQPSSIMPQKRNPVALEHARALASLAASQAAGVFQTLHNTPGGDIVDIEDDVQPLVFRAFRETVRTLHLLAAALDSAQFQREKMREAAVRGNTTMTELADTLVRRTGASFRSAHRTTAAFQNLGRERPELTPAAALEQAAAECLGEPLGWSDDFLDEVLSPENFVQTRSHVGGPAPETLREAIARSETSLSRHEEELQALQRRFEEFPQALRDLAGRLK